MTGCNTTKERFRYFHKFAAWVSTISGSPIVFGLYVVLVVVLSKETIDYISTVLPVALMFILQHSQNRGNVALHRKLDELIKAADKANDELQGIEKE